MNLFKFCLIAGNVKSSKFPNFAWDNWFILSVKKQINFFKDALTGKIFQILKCFYLFIKAHFAFLFELLKSVEFNNNFFPITADLAWNSFFSRNKKINLFLNFYSKFKLLLILFFFLKVRILFFATFITCIWGGSRSTEPPGFHRSFYRTSQSYYYYYYFKEKAETQTFFFSGGRGGRKTKFNLIWYENIKLLKFTQKSYWL